MVYLKFVQLASRYRKKKNRLHLYVLILSINFGAIEHIRCQFIPQLKT